METASPSKSNHFVFFVAFLTLLFPLLQVSRSSAQERLSDKDVEQLMKNLNSDAKKFRSMFNSALSKSTIRKTGEENDAKTFAEAFQNQTKNMADNFKQTKKADPYLQASLNAAAQIDSVFKSVQLDSDTTAQWARIKTQLSRLGRVFHVPGY
jgi:ABC-type Na+ efflux pump permease subunit